MKKLITLILSLLSFTTLAQDPKTAYDKYKEGKAIIIDVREADEIKSGMVEGAKWFPLSKLQNEKNWKKDFVKQTSGKEIYLYCRTGNRSGKFQTALKENGIPSTNIGGYETLKELIPVKVPGK